MDFPKAEQPTNAEQDRQAQEKKNALKSRMSQERIEGFITAVEQSIDGIVTSSMEKNVIFVNQAYAAMHGYVVEEMIGRRVEDFHDLSTHERKVEKDVAGNQLVTRGSWIGELVHIRKDGTLFSMYHCDTLLKRKDGTPTGIVSICRDITEHKRVEEEMSRLSSAVEHSIDGIASCSPEGRFTYMNKAYSEMHGYAPDEMIGMNLVDIYKEQEGTDIVHVKGQIDEWESWNEEVWHIRKDGTTFPTYTSFSWLPDHQGNRGETLTICRDITQQKLALQAAQESEERYRTLFEKANEAVLIVDPETGRILDANKEAERLLGRQREEIIRMNMVELHPPHQAEHYEDVFRNHIRWGQGFENRGEVLGKDGNIIPVSISTSVISIFGKKVVQGLFRDLTEEQRLSEYKEKLEDNKLIGKAKAILMDRYHISEKESLERLQKESRNQRKRMKEIAQAVITSQSILG